MKILIYSPVFYPMIGGMETVAECMADQLVKAGHECILITPITNDETDYFSFTVYRNPGIRKRIQLILWSDIVYSNGASLSLLPLAKVLGKPFVWKHAGYQASCIDGLGWVEGKPAPLSPWPSIKFHLKEHGFFFAVQGAFKLFVRRFAAKHLVSMNVAITDWVAQRQPFKKQVKINNPSPLYRFVQPSGNVKLEYDFVYMGRLVSEKGVKTLLNAFDHLVKRYPEDQLKLLIIGDGNKKGELEQLSKRLGLLERINFAGRKKGQELTDLVHSASIAIVPSEWEEPMGIVAIELMAAGRNIIVSENGGLKECVGTAGLSFPNGDAKALAGCMSILLKNKELAEQKKLEGRHQVKKFEPEILIGKYLELFYEILKKNQ